MKEIREIKSVLYHKIMEPTLLSKVVSVVLATTNLIYVTTKISKPP